MQRLLEKRQSPYAFKMELIFFNYAFLLLPLVSGAPRIKVSSNTARNDEIGHGFYCPHVKDESLHGEALENYLLFRKRRENSWTSTYGFVDSLDELNLQANESSFYSARIRQRFREVESLLNLEDIRHHNAEELREILNNVTAACPEIARTYSIGRSRKGEQLWVIEFSDNPGHHEVGEPEFRFIGNIHGNEVTGRELSLRFAKHLCDYYLRSDKRVVDLVESTRIHIMPSMNPDGFKIAQRYEGRSWTVGRWNWNGVDLNRDFPDLTESIRSHVEEKQGIKKRGQANDVFAELEVEEEAAGEHGSGGKGIGGPEEVREWGWNQECNKMQFLERSWQIHQPETGAVMDWIVSIPFVMSVTFHDGGIVAVYPFDKRFTDRWYTATPDDKLFRHLAKSYADTHTDMSDPSEYGTDANCRFIRGDFRRCGGIVNGASWSSISGGLEDFSYVGTNCFGIAVELSCTKWLAENKLNNEWDKNKEAMMAAVENVHMGIKGTVRHRPTGLALGGAIIHVSDQSKDVTTTRSGDYWRPLLPGIYKVYARHGAEISETRTVNVTNTKTVSEGAIVVDFVLY